MVGNALRIILTKHFSLHHYKHFIILSKSFRTSKILCSGINYIDRLNFKNNMLLIFQLLFQEVINKYIILIW